MNLSGKELGTKKLNPFFEQKLKFKNLLIFSLFSKKKLKQNSDENQYNFSKNLRMKRNKNNRTESKKPSGKKNPENC